MKLSFREYLALPEWSSHSLKAMRRGPPARVVFEREHPKEDTEATAIGKAVHAAFLEPETYLDSFAHRPADLTYRTNEGKAWRDEHIAAGRTILDADDAQTVERILEALMAKGPVMDSLRNASHREESITWTCPGSGEACKGRPDWITDGYVYDLKVSRHAESRWLTHRAYDEGWMHQLAHYRTGANALGIDVAGARLVVVTPHQPHLVHLLEVNPHALDDLEVENIATLRAMRECRLADHWPGTLDTWSMIGPPSSAVPAYGDVSYDPEDDA